MVPAKITIHAVYSKVTWNPLGQGSTNCATLPSWLGEHREYGEHEKYGKHQPGDLRHSIHDSLLLGAIVLIGMKYEL